VSEPSTLFEALARPHVQTADLFGGPGGWDEGARILGVDLGIEGIEWAADAVATARAAGHLRRRADVWTVAPGEYAAASGLIASPPCPTFSAAGKRSGLGEDYQLVLDAWTSIGWGIPAAEALADLAAVQDERTALLATAGVWALSMLTAGACEWIAFEQVPAVEYAWEDLAAELYAIGCEYVNVAVLDAADYGLPSRRSRAYLVASLHGQMSTARRIAPNHDYTCPGNLCLTPTPRRSMAEALGWGSGHRVITRGNRRPGGGGDFSADGPSWCLTGRARSWYRDDGRALDAAEAGHLSGFTLDYPWQGSRTAQFRQAGDVVSPVMAAHILAAAIGIDGRAAVADHLDALYTRDLEFAA
jgi:DNA (cytosine-5)-methyltransferase 1